jgi:hypothetical protein
LNTKYPSNRSLPPFPKGSFFGHSGRETRKAVELILSLQSKALKFLPRTVEIKTWSQSAKLRFAGLARLESIKNVGGWETRDGADDRALLGAVAFCPAGT